MYSPLEQFELSPFFVILSLVFPMVDLSLTIFLVVFFFAVGISAISFSLSMQNSRILPTTAQVFL